MAVYSQGVAQDTPVEAAAASIANNDIEFLENDSNNEGQVVKHYPATSATGTNAQTHDVRFFINDSDLNKVQDGLTTIRGNDGNANVNTIQHESTIELDADDIGTIDASDAGTADDPLGAMTDTDGYDSAGSPKTALVANTLAVKLGAAVKTFQIDAQDDVNGTFSLSADAIISDSVFLTATYKFNSVQAYSAVPTGSTGAGVDINTRRAKVTSTSDSGGEWVAIGEKSGVSLTHANLAASTAIDSKYFGGTVKIGSDASYAASGDSTIWVQDGDTLTVTYYGAGTDTDGSGAVDSDEIGSVIASTTATIDDSAPSISNVSPEDGTLTKDTSPDLSFTMTDTGSGFGSSVTTFGTYVAVYINGCIVTDAELGVSSFAKDAITVTYTAPVGDAYSDFAGIGATKLTGTIDCTDLSSGDAASEAEDRTSGGYEINTTADNGDTTLKRTIDGNPFPVQIVATDAAGNSKTLGARTGAGTTDIDIFVDSEAPSGTVTVTGAKAWSAADKKDVDDNSSIKLAFNETIDIDTVSASDFSISGTGVTSTEIVSITSGGGTVAGPELSGTAIYLDLGADLGPNAKPKVKLVSTITDLAGNEL
ncbi:MAG: Ig-like domain-containing protein, partial [Dehalococcoidia bacterium]